MYDLVRSFLDELHKFRQWRNWLKGIYDGEHESHQILVTGGARLDLYSRGDSLQGRFYFHRLHPFTLSELEGSKPGALDRIPEMGLKPSGGANQTVQDLLRLGGFPEPFLSGSETEADRWRLGYGTQLLRDDVRTLEQTTDVDRMELLLWDWSRVEAPAARFENLVAVHLLRLCHWLEDVHGQKCELRFFRTSVGHEVDFIVLRKGQPWLAVEAKQRAQPLDRNLAYLLERSRIPHAFQVHLDGNEDYLHAPVGGTRVRVLPAARFLANLP